MAREISTVFEQQEKTKEDPILEKKDGATQLFKIAKNEALQRIILQQKERMEKQTIEIKQYLSDIILPEVTNCIIKIVQEQPPNPLEFMIKTLLARRDGLI